MKTDQIGWAVQWGGQKGRGQRRSDRAVRAWLLVDEGHGGLGAAAGARG